LFLSVRVEVLAGLLTFPVGFAFPDIRPVALYKQTFQGGLQQQVLFRTHTGFPFIYAHQGTIAYHGCKGTTFL